MARFNKRVVGKGLYQTPTGPQEVTPARIQHWHDTIQGMLAAGHKPPLSWGHSLDALPHPDDHPFWKSRLNAGKVLGSSIDAAGDFWLQGEAPGAEIDAGGDLITPVELPDGRKVKAAIGEVSIGAIDWKDGSGKVWKDAPVHLALTPLPVWVPPGGQPGFVPAPPEMAQFGTRTLLARFSAMDEPAKKDPPGKPENDAPKPPEPPKPEAKAGGEANVPAIVNALRACGINLPYNVGDFDALLVALETIAASKGANMTQPSQAPAQAAPVPQEPGAFLSTIQDPVTRGLVARAIDQDKAKRLSRIEALSGRGLPAHRAQQLRQQASQAFFSTLPDGSLAPHPADAILDMLEDALPKDGSFKATYLSSMTEVPTPEADKGPQAAAEKHKKTADDLARRAGLPARTGGTATTANGA